ncbi:MAG: hypothetical protein QOC89_5784 [Paraburkholderia sp.]|nr:hypothetical protein [Paraburkholderia sp.]
MALTTARPMPRPPAKTERVPIDTGRVHQILRQPCNPVHLPVDHIDQPEYFRAFSRRLRINWLASRNGVNRPRNSCATIARMWLLIGGAAPA